ncbi:MAG: sel1 repeat family protein [Paucibacter sp.]|nr:sel1 repeat family protein [Roseateles sp.]
MRYATSLNTLLATLLIGLLNVAQADESAYNQGVEAWRTMDYVEARKQWAASIAEGGPDAAFNNLAYLLYNGLGGDVEKERAVELWRKGAALAVSEAQLHLGHAYEDGMAVDKNPALAYAWYLCTISNANRLAASDEAEAGIKESAEDARDSLLPALDAAQRAEGERIAKLLVARYGQRLMLDETPR